MSFKAKVLEVMIATPGDVATERLVARDVIYEWNSIHSKDRSLVLNPVGWETHAAPKMGDRPQAIINKQLLKTCDLLIAVFWTRLGSPTGKFASGTVEEIEEHLKAGKPAMIYFSSQPAALDRVQQDQYQALLEFKEACRRRGLIAEYTTPADFKEKLHRQLAQTVLRTFSKKNGPPSASDLAVPEQPRIPKLSNAARVLLREAAHDGRGRIQRSRSTAGLEIETNGVELVGSNDPTLVAKWESALRELRQSQLLEPKGDKGEAFSLTDEGYRIASLLRPEPLAIA